METQAAGAASWVFGERRRFAWKTALLALATLSLVPILLFQARLWGGLYVAALALVHISGVAIIVVGTRKHQIAPDRRGLMIRLVGIGILVALLALAAKGVETPVGGAIFWGALFAIWALHTAGLALLHVKGRREAALCPFV
ncbi:MAG: hypothetical protein ACYDBQ_07040 [Thermoplasmatota archaeon]